ncbi:MAG: DUF4389 domain-containing protein [Chloroflexi bacterium]|nr:DUF4389 domain-containing protein [Chloroflexota bacterium]
MGAYPAEFNVDYPEGEIGRLSALWRSVSVAAIIVGTTLMIAVPTDLIRLGENLKLIVILLTVLYFVTQVLPYFLPLPPLLMLLFRKRYPRWWYNLVFKALVYSARVGLYLLLMMDRYPSSDANQHFRLDVPFPDSRRLNRYLPLVKWLLAAPHYIWVTVLSIVWLAITPVVWIAVLATGRHPKALFAFSEGYFRYLLRVFAYAFFLTTDRYPSFRLRP